MGLLGPVGEPVQKRGFAAFVASSTNEGLHLCFVLEGMKPTSDRKTIPPSSVEALWCTAPVGILFSGTPGPTIALQCQTGAYARSYGCSFFVRISS